MNTPKNYIAAETMGDAPPEVANHPARLPRSLNARHKKDALPLVGVRVSLAGRGHEIMENKIITK